MPKIVWTPLESNPDSMSELCKTLGVTTIKASTENTPVSFGDVYGLDDELLAMVPQPVLAVIFLYPINKASEDQNLQHEKAQQQQQQHSEDGSQAIQTPSSLWFTKQTISNACGTIALIHALANNQDNVNFTEDSALKRYFEKTKPLSPAERGQILETEAEIANAHKVTAQGGQTKPPDEGDNIYLHFVTFVLHDGGLWELDGRRARPTYHGSCQDLLKGAAGVIKKQIEILNNSEPAVEDKDLSPAASNEFNVIYMGSPPMFD
ncbi:hypothetical protein H4219_004150 [Mycoemilia scoparia]|uniref:Ubiquitin carboxyl-terminal hydrolase n=1 Tax=Mycoemilia scoparia TaxID=417184 RepID=A0A9W8A0M8_9FUNG|nr:hypothetical protein H4219_004150 [Mycoemilia scoparia]